MEHPERADIVVFLARLGDQLRFSATPLNKWIMVSFAQVARHFASGFGVAHHTAVIALKDRIREAFACA